MNTKLVSLLFAVILMASVVAVPLVTAKEWKGYDLQARIFVGTGMQWCIEKFGEDHRLWCEGYLGIYANDKVVMKWNAEWDRGNAENWANPPYGAWENNEWNGAFPGGSGAVWHYKIKWIGSCGSYGTPTGDGGYCIWGEFEVLQDHGIDPNIGPGHMFFALAKPNGYGT